MNSNIKVIELIETVLKENNVGYNNIEVLKHKDDLENKDHYDALIKILNLINKVVLEDYNYSNSIFVEFEDKNFIIFIIRENEFNVTKNEETLRLIRYYRNDYNDYNDFEQVKFNSFTF